MVPPIKINSKGSNFMEKDTTIIPFEQVYVATDQDNAATINNKLTQGLHIIFSPGIYYINQPLVVTHANQILLGLGLATLVASKQVQTIIQVNDVDGVRICGVFINCCPSTSAIN